MSFAEVLLRNLCYSSRPQWDNFGYLTSCGGHDRRHGRSPCRSVSARTSGRSLRAEECSTSVVAMAPTSLLVADTESTLWGLSVGSFWWRAHNRRQRNSAWVAGLQCERLRLPCW